MLTPQQRECLTRAARLIQAALDGAAGTTTVEHENAMNRDTTVSFADTDDEIVIDMGPDFATPEYDADKHTIGYITILFG